MTSKSSLIRTCICALSVIMAVAVHAGEPGDKLWAEFSNRNAKGHKEAWRYYESLTAKDKLYCTTGMVVANPERKDAGPYEVFCRMIKEYAGSADANIQDVIAIVNAPETPDLWKTYLYLASADMQLWDVQQARLLRGSALEICHAKVVDVQLRRGAARFVARTTLSQAISFARNNRDAIGDDAVFFDRWALKQHEQGRVQSAEALRDVDALRNLLRSVPRLVEDEKDESALVAYDICRVLGPTKLIDTSSCEDALRTIMKSEVQTESARAEAGACLNILNPEAIDAATRDALKKESLSKDTKRYLGTLPRKDMSWTNLVREAEPVPPAQ